MAVALDHIRNDAPGTILLDTARRRDQEDEDGLLFIAPRQIIAARTPADVRLGLRQVAEAVRAGAWVAGYLSYEAGSAFVSGAPEPPSEALLAWWGIYDAPQRVPRDLLDAFFASHREEIEIRNAALGIEREAYRDRIEAIRRLIRAGEVYQINFTDHVHFEWEGDPLALYARMRARQRVPYGAYMNLGERHVLSCSPELFFRRAGDRIETRPMKGTVSRGRTNEEDEERVRWLTSDEKSRAENLMIVDLLRNDLSRCSVPGSVHVPHLFSAERYETVIQMTSTVESRLQPGTDYPEIFEALFPCGSITGAPKRRAMKHIAALENGPRGVYCGTIGYIAPDDRAVFSVAIRTVELDGGRGRMGTGSGVVWDSDADAEYDECRLKAAFLTDEREEEAFELIETMRAESGEVVLLHAHLDRMQASAEYFGRPFDRAGAERLVQNLTEKRGEGAQMIRLTHGADGAVVVTTRAAPSWPEPVQIGLSPVVVQSDSSWLYHKTSRRELYDRALEWARNLGLDEALLVNERGEVTEGSRSNLFARIDGVLCTPPVKAGALPGVARAEWIARETVTVRPITPEMLRRADGLYVCNAVRGIGTAVLQNVASSAGGISERSMNV